MPAQVHKVNTVSVLQFYVIWCTTIQALKYWRVHDRWLLLLQDQLPTVVVPEEDHIKSPCTAAEGSERYLGVFLPGLEQDAVVRKVQQVKQFQGKLNQRYRQLLSLQNIPHPPVSSAPAERTASSQHITSGAGWTEALHTHTVLATSCPSTTSDNPPVKQMWPLALEIIG